MVVEEGEVDIQPSLNIFEVLIDDVSRDYSILLEGEQHLCTDHIRKLMVTNASVRLTRSINIADNKGDDKKRKIIPPNRGRRCGRPRGPNRWR